MARNTSYTGSIDLISGVRPKNGGAFPLIDAADVQTREDGTRLDGELERFNESVSQLKDEIADLKKYNEELKAALKEIQDKLGGSVTPDTWTVAEINEMIVSILESKRISEVEA